MPTNYNITTNNAGYGPMFTRQDVTNQSPKEMRTQLHSMIRARGGVCGGKDFEVAYSGSGMTFNVRAGSAYVPSNTSGNGSYYQCMPAQNNVILDTNSTGYSRIDKIYLVISDRDYGTGATDESATLYVQTGTASASPTAPPASALPANYSGYLELAQITVPTGSNPNLVTTGAYSLTSLRAYTTSGTILAVTSGTRPSATSVWPASAAFTGMGIYETDTKSLRFYDGSNWVPSGVRLGNVGTAIVGTPSASTTQFFMQAGTYSGTTNTSGTLATAISFPTAFTGLLTLQVTPVQATSPYNLLLNISSQTATQFNVNVVLAANLTYGTFVNITSATAVKFNWLAIGW
ncbi:hypothetical protein UFOVP238_42 [uncultured Caudovirales phage]|uniref:Tail fiber protein n=1 Tax=uncultured Caudovirales phage TaxID=2100421 RepID=A0A6J7WQS0_9CAUD|nr:hypothetical protein UFOVP238_42 [uncultured Caudovirales phage]